MPETEVLERIKEAEAEAEDIVAEAETEGENLIAEAREEAESIRSTAREEAEAAAEERLWEARADIETEREKILEAGQAERGDLEENAMGRTDEVVAHVVDLFEEAVHAQT